jgi:hypothetical protein
MPVYEYHCDANGKTVEVNHAVRLRIRTWGELCYAAQIKIGRTDPLAPVRKIITKAPAVAISVSNSELKSQGFTKLVKRDVGVYENVTATGKEKRFMRRGQADTMPHLHKKIRD